MSAITGKISAERGDHAVHFYEADTDLARTVAAYLADALGEGGAAVVIATGPHTEALEQALVCVGIDVPEARTSGALTVLDARQTLSHLTVDGEIDREAFQRIVGGALREAGVDDRPVHAYGEMVDLLWQAGQIREVIELEKLWNELIDELPVSLLCAYHSEAVGAPQNADALDEVCRLHSSVSGAPAREGTREFQPDRHAPGAARRFVEEALRQWGHSEALLDDARLLLSELVTNAVVHARSPFSVSIRSQDSRVRLAVRDENPAEPTQRPPSVEAVSGRGLQIVAALAKDWGVVATPSGKTVWAEL